MKMLAEIAKDALELTAPERLVLARILLDTSGEEPDFSPDAEAAWEEEICRRMKAVEAGTAQTRSSEEVFADLDRRFPSCSSASSRRPKPRRKSGPTIELQVATFQPHDSVN